jgi:hypothetical protein
MDGAVPAVRTEWSALGDEEITVFDSHHRAADYAETTATWLAAARDLRSGHAEELFVVPN